MRLCPCGFDGVELGRYSSAWYRAHRDTHLATMPTFDQCTADNLDMFVRITEAHES